MKSNRDLSYNNPNYIVLHFLFF